MAEFDNMFDAAISRADAVIRDTMGVEAKVTSGALAGSVISGVFDDPENISYAGTGVRVEGSSPSLFVETVSISQLHRLDTLVINGQAFWIDRIPPDDCGSCNLLLGRGIPPVSARRR